MNEFEVRSLFPVPLCLLNYKQDEQLEKFLREQKVSNRYASDEMKGVLSAFGSSSENLQILRTQECGELRKFILDRASILADKILGLRFEEMIDCLSWVSIKSPNEAHQVHAHPNSVISGVYYFDDNNTPINFYDVKGSPDSCFELRVPKKTVESVFAESVVQYLPRKGNIVLFPSYLRHSVDRNTTNEKRYSLAFNIIPRFGLGSSNELTLLNYKDLT